MEDMIDLAVMGIGAGAKGTVTGWLSKVMPGVSEDIAALIAGGALYWFGDRIHPMVKKFGAGVLIAGIGQLTSGLVPKLGGGATAGGGGATSTTPITLGRLAEAEAARRLV
ncbi:MAG: hypothetical protein QMD13_09360 [Candidatus Bathyarchaeia archaeon]|nr:hypothetical protein [Candidatus Bathyarchaeia archaeon]